MIQVAGLALLRPIWLLAPLLVLALVLLVRQRGALGDWRRAIDASLLEAMTVRGAVEGALAERKRLPLAAAAAVLVGIALAGPALERSDAGAWRNLDGVLVAVDLSQSMVPAVAEARVAARQIAAAAGSRQTGLLVYAGDVYQAATFTADREALDQLIDAVGDGLVPDRGSAPERVFAFAEQRFAAAAIQNGDLVFVTDGGGIDEGVLSEARRFADIGHRVDVVFVAPTVSGDTVPAPDRDAAEALADAGGGRFADAVDPDAVTSVIPASTAERLGRSPYAVLAWFDAGRFVAALALLPMILMFRRRR